MAGGKKKHVGGVRQVLHPAPPPPPKKKVGGVRGPISSRPVRKVGGVRRQVEAFAPLAPPVPSVMWKYRDVTVDQWTCPYGCSPVELSMSWTHDAACPYWEREGKKLTPFDRLREREEPDVERGVGPGWETNVPIFEEGVPW